ncbi:MAG: hypothetical protein ACK5L8_00685 [Marinicella pacifica]
MNKKLYVCFFAVLIASCGQNNVRQYDEKRIEYSSTGEIQSSKTESGGMVISELRRQFDEKVLTGEGRIQNTNEGLARRAATQLAVGELAAKVETEVRGNTRIYNNSEVRDVLETRVAALVQNYQIDYAGYEDGGRIYVVKVSLTGKRIVEEFQRNLR